MTKGSIRPVSSDQHLRIWAKITSTSGFSLGAVDEHRSSVMGGTSVEPRSAIACKQIDLLHLMTTLLVNGRVAAFSLINHSLS